MEWNGGMECDSYFHSIHLLGVMEWMSEWMKMQRKSKEIDISFLSSFHSNLHFIPPSFHSIIPNMPFRVLAMVDRWRGRSTAPSDGPIHRSRPMKWGDDRPSIMEDGPIIRHSSFFLKKMLRRSREREIEEGGSSWRKKATAVSEWRKNNLICSI